MYSSYRKLTFSEIFQNKNNKVFQYLPNNKSFFMCATARGGLEVCIKLIGLKKKDSVLMPALTAEGAIRPFLEKNVNVILFDINEDLQIDVNKIDKMLDSNSSIRCLLIIHYLGVPQEIDKIKDICEKRGIYLIEDCAQSLFSNTSKKIPLGSYGHISLFSLGKTIPVLDGAIFFVNSSKIAINKISYSFSIQLLIAKLILFINLFLNNYIQEMQKTKLFWKLNNLNKTLYRFYYYLLKKKSKPAKMSFISNKIIKNLNYEEIIKNTKSNIKLIYDKIDRTKYKILVKNYDCNFFLLGIPIIANNRNELRESLRKKGIFCSIFDKYWNYIPYGKEKVFPNTSNILKNLLILPVSYKYKKNEIIQMVRIINEI